MAKIVFRLMAKMFLCRLLLRLGDGKIFFADLSLCLSLLFAF